MTEIERDDELPIFRPRPGTGGSRPSPDGARSFRNAILARLRGGTRRGARSAAPVHPLQARARRVVVKAHLLRMGPTAAKAAALHVRYIERDGVEKDGSKGMLYDAQGTVRARVFEQPRPGEKHQFRFIVSPEDGSEIDLTVYVRRLMATLELDIGRKVEWAAVNHFDTSHPHAHIVVRGIDRDGREVRIDRGYISAGMRRRAQELATEELGPRPERDVRRAQEREVTQQRFTTLDRELERRGPDHLVEARTRAPSGRIDESLLIARLEHLERLRLAERVSRTSWRLVEGSGLTFLAHAPDGFSGRAQRAEGPMASSAYTVVSDGQRFIVLRATPALRALYGQSVAVTRDAKGRLLIRPALDKDLGR